jgi:catechol 2,3-dioxygenase-like lactoylglutathione lyase family enzyme
MSERAHINDLIPFVPVRDVDRSIRFYQALGFRVTDTHIHQGELDFAALVSDRAQLMLARAPGPGEMAQQRVLFYLYTADLDGLRANLLGGGLNAGPIVDGTPGPEREMQIRDPDGYCLMIAETGAS